MFGIEYKIVNHDYDDFVGQSGFFKIIVNDCAYGEIYPDNLLDVMRSDYIFDWIERLIKALILLENKNYVAVSDVESYNTWIEFQRKEDDINISVVKSDKWDGSKDIELSLKNPMPGEWINQRVKYSDFKKEVYLKVGDYIKYLINHNGKEEHIESLKKQYESIYCSGD